MTSTPEPVNVWTPAGIFVIAALVLSLAITWISERSANEQASEEASAAAFAQVRAVSLMTAGTWMHFTGHLAEVEAIAALTTRTQLRGEPVASTMEALKRTAAVVGPQVLQVSALRPDGTPLWSTGPAQRATGGVPDLPPDLPYVHAIVERGLDRFTGRPGFNSDLRRSSGEFARAVRGPDGSLLAITVISVDTAFLDKLFTIDPIDQHGISFILRDDGERLIRSVDAANVPLSPDMLALLGEALLTGKAHQLHTSIIDSRARFYDLAKVPGTDVVVGVGLDRDFALAPVLIAASQNRQQAVLLSVALGLLALAVLFAYHRDALLRAERLGRVASQQSEVLLRTFADAARDTISLHDEAFRYLYVNPAVEQMLGVPAADLIGQPVGQSIEPEDVHLLANAKLALQQGGDAQRITCRVRQVNGSIRWWESEILRLDSDPALGKGQLTYICMSRDVTDRKLAERVLVEAQDNQQALLRETGCLLLRYRTTHNGRSTLRVVGAGASSFIGYPIATVEAPGFMEGGLDRERATALADLRSHCLRFGASVQDTRFRAPSGDWNWSRMQGARIAVTEDDEELLIVVTDVTTEYQERESHRLTARLAALGEVASGIAHEMNQPLAVISMAAENGLLALSIEPGATDKIAAKFLRIQAQATRLAKVINHIRNFNRVDPKDSESFELAVAVEEAMFLARTRLSDQSVAVTLDLDPTLPPMQAHRVPLEQVLMNLMINAADAYRDNPNFADRTLPRPLRLEARRDGDGCRFRLADQAGGISNAVLDRIFTPFVTTKNANLGTGLGLSLCASSLSQMGGWIKARNENGGAVFEFHVPRMVNHQQAADTTEAIETV